MEHIEADGTEHIEAEGMEHIEVVGTEVESHSRYLQVEHIEVEGMDTEAEGMEHMSPEAEGMDHMAPDLVRRRGIMLGDAAKNRHRSDDVSERNQLGE
jgi:hypothetical protein